MLRTKKEVDGMPRQTPPLTAAQAVGQMCGHNEELPASMDAAMRMGALSVVERLTRETQQRAEALDLLMKLIPWSTLSQQQEALLYGLFSNVLYR